MLASNGTDYKSLAFRAARRRAETWCPGGGAMNQPAPVLRRSEIVLAVLAALLFSLLFFHFALREMPYFRDIFHEFYPMKVFLAEHLHKGRIPLWNPYPLMGMPFLAELATACFYPLNVLFLFLSPLQGLRYYLLLHYPLAGVGMYLLLRDFRLRPAAAALGAMSFAFSGYLVAQHTNLIYLISPCYFPWALFCFRRSVLALDFRWALAAGVSIALPFLAGEPQGAGLAAVMGLAYALFAKRGAGEHAATTPKTPLRKTLSLLAVSLLFALGLSMIQFLPSWEFTLHTERAHGLLLEQSTCWSFYPLRLLELVWPNLWGLPWPEDHFWGGFMTDWCFPLPFSMGVYLGLWPLLAAALALRSRNPQAYFFALLGLVSLLLALGRYTPFYSLAYHLVPGLRLFRYPEKYLAPFSFGLAALAGIGTHSFLEHFPPGRRFRLIALVFLALLIALGLFGWLGQDAMQRGFATFLRQPRVGHIRSADAADALLFALARTAVVALVLAGAFLVMRAKTSRRRGLPPLLLAITALDLYTAGRPLVPTAPDWLYTTPSKARELIRERQADPSEKFRTFRDRRVEYSYGPLGDTALPIHIAQRIWQKDTLKPNWNLVYGIEEMTGYTPAMPEGISRLWEQAMTVPLLKSFNIKYALVAYDWSMFDHHPEAKPVAYDRADNFRLLLLEGYFPRAYLVPQARAVPTEKEAVARLLNLDLKQEVVLITSEALPADMEGGSFAPAEVVRYESGRVELRVRSEHPAWLVLADAYFPGWKAWVNGKPTKVYRANYLVRAVAVGPGESRVEFVYQPESYRWGRAMTFFTLALAISGILGQALFRRVTRARDEG